ncbi:RNA polymerase sigma factor [Faecalicatena sp. AGMB00832]|uniref:RNA polymerase sigma factor n=1 Tax=Faecalicatena faecalis TaxID=2726362 RepID=A0ABS6D0B4_9FIRM|nr:MULTISPECIES: RNA polymerase sigma factor [Faecalicatena]MBU3874851.1 RNA polymerase sigma factor [Faecalicatena faecalis]MCI6465781.1 RNA polymerase sigma factor [Faecalicatena sp.]MDY5618803.1 RNA polymerase sigma factor [Lachnospiraceae bacterium]
MEDNELIRRIQNGQKEYLNEIAAKYYDDIYYFCAYQTGNREDAYDLAQETFLRFIRYVDSYRYRNLKGYLLTIAMNLCRTYFHETARKRMGQEYTEEIAGCAGVDHTKGNAPDTVTGNTAGIGRMEQSQVLSEALLKLPAMQREAVVLHHFYGYKNREIAHMTGASCAAVKSRINQGLDKLKNLLHKEDFYE